jgi:hypothetical protein
MSQMPNPLSPSQFNLTDPTFFLRDLEARKAQYQAQAPAISEGSSRKDTAPKLAVTPTTPGQDPRSRTYDASTASTAARNPVAGLPKDRAMFDQLRAAAEAQYRNEIDAIKLGAMYGATADPLSMRRIGERYTNAIRGIAAQERMAGRRELYRDRIRDRVAAAKTAKAETNAIAADALRRNAERYSTMADTSAEAVQRKNQEYLDRLVREYRAAPTEPAAPAAPAAPAPRAPAAAPIPGPAPVAPPATEPEFVGPATWLQYYRDAPQQEQPGFGQIAQEVRRLAGETPTGQLSSVTAPSSDEVVTPAPDKYGDWFSWVEEGGDIPKEARLTKEDLSAALIGEEQMQPTNLQRLAELANTFTPGGYRFGKQSQGDGSRDRSTWS